MSDAPWECNYDFAQQTSIFVLVLGSARVARADVVTDWNDTLNDAIIATPSKHNPGNPTRTMAMMNGAIYDVFQAVDPQHSVQSPHADANWTPRSHCRLQGPLRYLWRATGHVDTTMLTDRLNAIADSPEKTAASLGKVHWRTLRRGACERRPQFARRIHADRWTWPLESRSARLPETQKGWGSDWGFVTPWAIPNPDHFDSLVGRQPLAVRNTSKRSIR